MNPDTLAPRQSLYRKAFESVVVSPMPYFMAAS